MPEPYSQDLREKVIKLIESGKTQAEIARFLEINSSTVYRWNKRYKEEGNCRFKGYHDNKDKIKIKDLKKFEELVKNNDLTLEQYAKELKYVGREGVRGAIKRLGYTYKKTMAISRAQ